MSWAWACASCALIVAPLASADDYSTSPPTKDVPEAFNKAEPKPQSGPTWGVGDGKSWWIPAADILGFQIALNLVDRNLYDHDYNVDFDSIRHNFKHDWVYDDDPFSVNQFLHPYQGSVYFTAARSAGLDFWPSSLYATVGSAVWEVAGETTSPSINDQYTTSIAGSFLGEALFRLSSLVLETSSGRPGFWREWTAGVISPATGFNRWAYGDRFDGVFRSHDPAVYTRFQLGANLNATVHSNVNRNTDPAGDKVPQDFRRGEGTADFTVTYGLPGKKGYTYDRPFDFFQMQVTAVTSNALESVMVSGLLVGAPYESGPNGRGIWGLFGNYDYLSPQIYRVSNTGLGLGTNGQWWVGKETAVAATAIVGVGYGSAGTIRGSGDRDYHHGITPQITTGLRWIFGDNAAVEFAARGYRVTSQASEEKNGRENIARIDAGITWRVWHLHGITLKYVYSLRDASYGDRNDTHQTVGAVSLGYTYLGHTRFGAVEWRPDHP
jgi:hypothetical protein